MSIKYNYGGTDIDLADYIRNIEENAKLYIDNQKNWTQQQKQEFFNSVTKYQEGLKEQLAGNTGRFSTDITGTIQDRQGILSNTDDDDIDPSGSQYYYDDKGQRIATGDYNLLSKKKQKKYKTFNANQQAAAYLDWIGKWTLKKTKELAASTPKFNLSNNGFEKYFQNQNQPNGGELDNSIFLKLEDNAEDTTKRTEFLKNSLSEYMNSLKEGDDYSNTPFKDITTYKQRLQEAINSLAENGYNPQDNIALKRAGISDKFLTEYFSTKSETPKSDLEKQALEAAKNIQEREENAKLQEIIDKDNQQTYELERKNYFDTFQKEHPFELADPLQAVPLSYNLKGVNDYIRNKYNPENEEQFKQATIQYVDIPQLVNYIRGKGKFIKNGKDITAQHIANHLDYLAESNAYEDPKYLNTEKKSILGDYYVLPGSENYDDYTFIAYNPTTRRYQIQSMLANELLKEKMAYANYDKKNKKFQKGGNLKYWKEYENSKQEQQEEQKSTEQKAKETGKSVEQVKAGERKPLEEGFSGLSGHDIARLTLAGTDIASIIASYVPVYGTAASAGMGLFSTLGNFVNNVAEDGMDVQDWKDLAYGAAMDAAGIIPGISATKYGKISKTLSPIMKTIFAGLSTYGLTQSAESTAKLFNNPSELTVDDWKNILTGIQALAGGARNYKMHKNIKNNRGTVETVYSTKAKSGNDINLTKEQLEDLKKIKGIEAQNKYLQDHGIQEELAAEFKQGFNKIRHFKDAPKVQKNKTLTTKDWTNEEYIPVGFDVVNGKVIPKWWTDAYYTPSENSNSFKKWYFNKTHTKNPLFKPAQEAPTAPAASIIQKASPVVPLDPKIKDLLTRQRIADSHRQIAMDTNPEYLFRKEGGIINRVKKFQKGTDKKGITNTTSKADWFNHIYNSEEFKNWINTFNKDNYQDFNNLQTSWNDNRIATKYTPGMEQIGPHIQSVVDRQKIWNTTGLNANIQRLIDQGLIVPKGNTGDNANGRYIDGYFGEQEWLRHGGSSDSWYGHEAELKAFKDMLASKGLDYSLNTGTGMYELGLLDSEKIKTKPITPTFTSKEEKEIDESSQNNKKGVLKDIYNKLNDNLILKYGIPRALYADSQNKKLTQIALENEKPNFIKPLQFHRYIISNLDSEMQGSKAAARLYRGVKNPITSDASQYQAAVLEAIDKGNQFINQGKAISNDQLEKSSELSLQQNKENLKSRYDTAIANSIEASKTAANKARAKMAYLAKKHNIKDTVWSQFEYDDKIKQSERKAYEDNFVKKDIENTIKYDLENQAKEYGLTLTPEQLAVWDEVASGSKTYSTLDSDEGRKNWLEAQRIAQQIQTNMLKEYYGISDNKWSKIRTFQNPKKSDLVPNITLSKKGGKLNTNKIRERIKNADRFQKSAEKGIDRNEKAIERMYKYKNKKK